MDIEEIKKLMEMMEERGVVELEIKNASGEIRLVRENHRAAVQPPTVVGTAPSPHVAPSSYSTAVEFINDFSLFVVSAI